MAAQRPPEDASAPAGQTIDRLLYQFDQAWRSGTIPSIESFLPAGPAGLTYRRALLEELIKIGKITFYPQSTPAAITPGSVKLAFADGRQKTVDADFVLLLTGYVADSSLFEMLGVELHGDSRAPVFNPDTMETNVPGVYVAGTATAGTQQRFKVFIENCHVHVQRIVQAFTGKPSDIVTTHDYGPPEN